MDQGQGDATKRATTLAAEGRPGEAADVLLESLLIQGALDTHAGTLIDYLIRAKRPLTDLARAIPADQTVSFMGQVAQLDADVAERMLQACFDVMTDNTAVLATAATVGRRMPVDLALKWSARLRRSGHGDACPLVAVATGSGSSVARARAAAAAVERFDDPRARDAFATVMAQASRTERRVIADETAITCPALAFTPVFGAVPERPTTGPLPDPLVGIVIPCFNQAELTLDCLASLAETTDPALFEVILVDNGSTDATRELSVMGGPRFTVVRNETNMGFGPACNQGAGMGRTPLVLFLNNDTRLLPGWLEPLLAAMDEDDRLGAVQPKLIYPDGRLNDAGGLIFAQGQAWVYGKGQADPDAPPYSCRRAPDYASGACLLVRREAFEAVGGFDDRYAPAYYEDVDLSFAMRTEGWRVMYEPTSTVIHLEGGTSGTDPTQGFKKYQVRNLTRFVDKWADHLAGRPSGLPANVESWAHRPTGGFGPGEQWLGVMDPVGALPSPSQGTKSILYVQPFMPESNQAAGQLRVFHMLKCLRRDGHSVAHYATGGGDQRCADELGRVGVTCYGRDPHRATEATYRATYFPPLEELLARRHFDVVILSPWDVGELAIESVRRAAPQATLILDTIDAHFVRLARQAALGGSGIDQAGVADIRRRELAVYRLVDRVMCVTDTDADAIRAEIPHAEVAIVPLAYETVDHGPGFDHRRGALFVGNFRHPPNLDALEWWVRDIAALVAARVPQCTLTVAGHDPGGAASRYSGSGISVAGTVPLILPYLHRARVSVAPLRYGSGMKGKILEALAAGTPVVTTSIGAEGMALTNEKNALIADTPDTFARAVFRLCTEEDLWARLRHAGIELATERYGLNQMRAALEDAIATPKGQRTMNRVTTGADPPGQSGTRPMKDLAGQDPNAHRQVTIALVTNTYNEAHNLTALIQSCEGVDQIVVGDMESDDGTVAMAQAMGATILNLPHAGYCEPGRQAVVNAPNTDWILVLDGDERLSPGGVDELRQIAKDAPADISAFVLPRITQLGTVTVSGTGWGTGYKRHPRFFRRGTVTWPATIHAVPSFTGRCLDLPSGCQVRVTHEAFRSLDHAWQKFNHYSGVEAKERADAGTRSTWLTGLDDAIGEFGRRYQPDIDGGISLALSFGLFFYRMGVHLKALDISGQLARAPVPSAPAMMSALRAMRDELKRLELTSCREQADSMADDGDLPAAQDLIASAMKFWGANADLLTDAAVLAARSGDVHQGLALVDQALIDDPTHAPARTTRLALEVLAGRRPPVTHVLVGRDVGREGEIVVMPPGTQGGDIEAEPATLPFAAGTLLGIRLSPECIPTQSVARQSLLDSLHALLAPGGTLEVLEDISGGNPLPSPDRSGALDVTRPSAANTTETTLAAWVAASPDQPIRLNLGCGDDLRPGWVNIDANVSADWDLDLRQLDLPASSTDEVLLSHALEHFSDEEVPLLLARISSAVSPQGRLLVNVPDLAWVLRNWLALPEQQRWGWALATVFGLQDNPGEYHRTGFSPLRLDNMLRQAGFSWVRVRRLFSHGQGCLWAEARHNPPPIPPVSVLISPSTAQEAADLLACVLDKIPPQGELVVSERGIEAGSVLAQVTRPLTWLRNAERPDEDSGLAQAACVAAGDRVIAVHAGGQFDISASVRREDMAYVPDPEGLIPPSLA